MCRTSHAVHVACASRMLLPYCRDFTARTLASYAAQNGVHFGSSHHPYNIGDSTHSAEAFRQLAAAKGLTMLQLTANFAGPLTQVRDKLPGARAMHMAPSHPRALSGRAVPLRQPVRAASTGAVDTTCGRFAVQGCKRS